MLSAAVRHDDKSPIFSMVIVVSTVSIAVLGARRVRRREDDNGAVQALAAAGHGADRAAAGVVLRPLAKVIND